jgi:hypothetical protein
MDACGRERVGTFKSITYNLIELRDSAFQKGRGYICGRTMGDRAERSLAVRIV